MAHPQQRTFMESVKRLHPAHFMYEQRHALDVGCLDINGNNRYLFEEPDTLLGCDVVPGRNVDIVMPAHLLPFRDEYFHVIVSTEAFEHDIHLGATLLNIVRMLAPGGLFAFTCATTGRHEHGTRRTSPADAPGLPWPDWYMNVTEEMVRAVLDCDALFSSYAFSIGHETHDLYFWGVKR